MPNHQYTLNKKKDLEKWLQKYQNNTLNKHKHKFLIPPINNKKNQKIHDQNNIFTKLILGLGYLINRSR